MIAFSSSIFWTGLGEKVKQYNRGQAAVARTREQLDDQIFFCKQWQYHNNETKSTTRPWTLYRKEWNGMECNVCHTFAINYVPINCDCGQWMRMPSEITWTGLSWNMSSGIIVTINTFSLPHSHKSHRSRGRKDQKVLHCAIKTSEDTQQDGGYGWGSHSDSMLWPTDRLYLLMKLLTRNARSFLNNL